MARVTCPVRREMTPTPPTQATWMQRVRSLGTKKSLSSVSIVCLFFKLILKNKNVFEGERHFFYKNTRMQIPFARKYKIFFIINFLHHYTQAQPRVMRDFMILNFKFNVIFEQILLLFNKFDFTFTEHHDFVTKILSFSNNVGSEKNCVS